MSTTRMAEEELLADAEALRRAAGRHAGTMDLLTSGEELRAIAGALEELVLVRKLLTWVGYDGWQVPDQVYDLVAYLADGDPDDGAWYPPRIGPAPRPRTLEEMTPDERRVAVFDRMLLRMMRHGLHLEDGHGERRRYGPARPYDAGEREPSALPYDPADREVVHDAWVTGAVPFPWDRLGRAAHPDDLEAAARRERTALARALGAGRR